jgi:hypothetical protein
MSDKIVHEYKQQFGGRNKQVTYVLKHYIFHLFNPNTTFKKSTAKRNFFKCTQHLWDVKLKITDFIDIK